MRSEGIGPAVSGWSNRPLVLETDGTQVWSLVRTSLVFGLAFLPVLLYLTAMGWNRQVTYETTEAQLAYERLMKTERELTAERARLESLREIEGWALAEHGLCAPSPEEVVVVRDDRPREATWLAHDRSGD